jgi:hypothetical protein
MEPVGVLPAQIRVRVRVRVLGLGFLGFRLLVFSFQDSILGFKDFRV